MRRASSDNRALGVPLAILLVALATLPPLPELVRVVAAILFSAVAPGIALEQALRRRAEDPLVRTLTVVATSIALTILIGLLVDTLGIELTRTSRVVSVGIGSLLLCAVGIVRGGGEEPLVLRPRAPKVAVLAAVVLGALTVTAAAIATNASRDLDADSPVTSVWIGAGAHACTVGVSQHHAAPATYRLSVVGGDNPVSNETLRSDGNVEYRLPVAAVQLVGDGRLTAELRDAGSGRLLRRASVLMSECGTG